MQTFKTDRPKIKRKIIIEYSMAFLFLLAIYLLKPVLHLKASNAFIFIFIGITAVKFVLELFRKRILQISFDEENSCLHITSQSFVSKPVNNRILYRQVKIEIEHNKFLFLKDRVALYFLREKFELFRVDFSKDGFLPKTLLSITDKFKNLSIPVKNF